MAFEQLESFFVTDIGRVRDNNEDAVLALPQHGVFCVADGMGGAHGGEVASRIVADNTRAAFESAPHTRNPSLDSNIEILRQAAGRADTEIKAWADEHAVVGTGTTLVALIFDPQCPFFGSVLHAGDSRAYRYRNETLSRLSKDHSMANALGMEDESHLPSLFQGVITNAIGAQEGKDLEENTFDVEEGDIFLVCSDGLTRMLQDDDIAAIIRDSGHDELQEISSRLVERANASGGIDNISVGLIRIENDKPAKIGHEEGKPGTPEPEPRPGGKSVSPVDEAARRFLERRDAASAPKQSARRADVEPVISAAKKPELYPASGRPEPAHPASHSTSMPPPPGGKKAEPTPRSSNDRKNPTPSLDSPSPRKRVWIWVLVLVAGIAVAFYLTRTFAGKNRSSSSSEPISNLVAQDAIGDAVTEQEIAEIREMVQDALETGQWETLKTSLPVDPAKSEEILKKAALDTVYHNWRYFWDSIRYSESSDVARAEYLSYCESLHKIWDSLDLEIPFDVQSDWPGSPELQADFVCRESCRLQKLFLSTVTSRIDAFADRLSMFQGDRSVVLNALCAMGDGGPGPTEQLETAILEAESRILTFRQWMEVRGSFPLDQEVLREITESTLPAISKSVDVVGNLLRQNLLALSAISIRDCCGKDEVSDSEVDNILFLRDRAIQPRGKSVLTRDGAGAQSDWFTEVDVEQVGFFLKRLALKCKAD